MVKKLKQLLSVTMALAMIFSSLGISEKTISAETTETNVVYSGNFAYDKTTGHLYEFVKETKSWNDAKSAADTKGGYLVCISSAEENALVSKLANDNSDERTVWIGLQRNAEQLSEWRWLDGTTVEYTNWYTGEPNSTAETVAELYNKSDKTVGTWNDNKATALNHFVVEYSACSHPDSKYVYENRTLTDCTVGGYTGEKYCGICNTKLSDGTTLEPQEHEEGVFDESSVIEATCENDGFSGNYICPYCETILTAGTVVQQTGHTAAADLKNVVEANCYRTGYSGDTYCSTCDEIITAGTSIVKTNHDFEAGICKNCGMINGAQLGTTYTMELTRNQLVRVIKFTVPNEGNYTIHCKNTTRWDSYGYLFTSSNYSDEMISNQLEAFYSGTATSIRRFTDYEYSNDDSGENGAPEIKAKLNNNTTYYFVVVPYSTAYGAFEVTISCNHDSTHIEGRTIANCTTGGYTGDEVCDICNATVNHGTTVAADSEHGTAVLDEDSVIEATCENDGFSGNYICPYCETILTAGTVVQQTGHTAAADLKNAAEANCYRTGYSGDTYCSTCDEIITAGTSIVKTNHDFEAGICKNCGMINGAQLGTTYTMELTRNQLVRVIKFTVPNEGNYTIHCKNTTRWDSYGYLFTSSNYSDEMISDKLAAFYAGTAESIRFTGYQSYNDDSGENGAPEIKAKLNNNTTYYFVVVPYSTAYGAFEVTISCNHDSTHIVGRTLTNCTTGGYTGNEVCDVCDAVLELGSTIEPSEHGTAVLDEDSVIEATCENDGFSGNYICPYCETILTAGTVVPQTGHTVAADLKNAAEANCYCNGYTGDTYCSTCDEIITTGTTIERTNHQYEDHICKNCGRVEDAQEGVTYSLKTTESFLYQIIEFKPEHDGMFEFYCENTTDWDSYGYLYQGVDFSEEMLVAAMKSGSYREGIKGYIYSNDDGGSNSAPAIEYPLKKGETYYFVVGPHSNAYGEFDITINCAHAKTHIENKTIENCVSGGYSGDVVCDECHKVIITGTQLEPNSTHDFIATKHIDATCSSYEYIEYKCLNCGETGTEVYEEGGYGDHSYELVGYIAPTCTTDGCSGHYECIYCEEKQTGGDVVLKSYHYTEEDTDNDFFIYNYNAVEATCENAGYTGDTKCTICNEIVEEGQVIPAKAHNFATGVCTKCGIPQSITEVEVDGYYQISTFDDLIEYLYIQKQAPDAGVKGKLMNDIAFPENYKDDDNLMEMTYLVNNIFDGNGHTISGINVKGEPCPLFTIVYCSEIKNLNIECSGVTNTEYNMNAYLAYVGIQSKFTKCSLSGSKTIEYNGTDEIVSAMLIQAESCEFIECTNDADISVEASNGNVFVAGLVGAASGTSFSKCVNNGSITVTTGGTAEVAGVTLYIDDSYAKQCTNNGDITVEAEDEASVAGVVSSMTDSSLEECTNNGILSANSLYEYSEVSGIVMYARHNNRDVINISKCKNTGKLEGMYVSGICGQADNTIIDDCTNTADIEASNSASGILSYGNGNIKLRNCQNDGNISGCNGASGICETIEFYSKSINEIEGCVNNGNITSMRYAAGIIGYASNMKITDCYNNGNIKANLYAGGILSEGYHNKVSNCVNNGNISGFNNIGGIAGYDEGSIFDKIYNTGKIDSENEAYIKNPLVNGNYNTEINESEENHIHNFNFSEDVVKATIDKDGYAEGKCVCGQNYKGVISKIASVDISNVKYEYTGKNIVLPSVTVKDSKGNVIDSKYYTVVYRNKATDAVVTQVKDIGTYEVVIIFNTIYSGEVTKTFTVEKKNDTVNSNGNKENNTGTTPSVTKPGTTPSVTKVTKPGRVKGVSAKKLKRRIRIKWRKLKQVKGYQVRYATNKKMKKAKIKTVAKNKFVIKKAKNKKYYIQVRAYRVDAAGKKIVGKWSKKKVVKIK